MQFNMTIWTRDWEHFNKTESGMNGAEGLSDDEVIEYLRWMACNRPERYVRVMSAFAQTQGIPKTAVAV